MLSSLLFQAARQPWAGAFVGWGFQFGSLLIPIRRVGENKHAIAFKHPRPCYADHLLVVPRQRVRTVFDLLSPGHESLWRSIHSLCRQLPASPEATLFINGGSRQDVLQAHLHFCRDGTLLPYRPTPTAPGRETHAIRAPALPLFQVHHTMIFSEDMLATGRARRTLLQLCTAEQLEAAGFSVYFQCTEDPKSVVAHLTAGAPRSRVDSSP